MYGLSNLEMQFQDASTAEEFGMDNIRRLFEFIQWQQEWEMHQMNKSRRQDVQKIKALEGKLEAYKDAVNAIQVIGQSVKAGQEGMALLKITRTTSDVLEQSGDLDAEPSAKGNAEQTALTYASLYIRDTVAHLEHQLQHSHMLPQMKKNSENELQQLMDDLESIETEYGVFDLSTALKNRTQKGDFR